MAAQTVSKPRVPSPLQNATVIRRPTSDIFAPSTNQAPLGQSYIIATPPDGTQNPSNSNVQTPPSSGAIAAGSSSAASAQQTSTGPEKAPAYPIDSSPNRATLPAVPPLPGLIIRRAAAGLGTRLAPPAWVAEPATLVGIWTNSIDPIIAHRRLVLEGSVEERREPLESFGLVLSVYRFSRHEDANNALSILRTAFPDATFDFDVRYAPVEQPRLYAFEKVVPVNATGIELSRAVRIGIVDGKVDYLPALKLSQIASKDFATESRPAYVGGHGTAIALLIAGRMSAPRFSALAPGSKIFSAVAIYAGRLGPTASTDTMVRALDWLIGQRVEVINLSLGGRGDAVLKRIIGLSASRAIIVAAAGNGGPNAPPSYPAAYPSILAVTATDADNQVYRSANRGRYISIAAPGVDVWVPTTSVGQYLTGTSFAAAITTGAIARLLADRPGIEWEKVRDHLCMKALDLGEPGADSVFGCGLIRLE